MLLNFAFCIVGSASLALVHVASFLYGLGCDTRSMTGGVPLWVLLAGAAVLPLLGCVCCFYASLSVGGKSASLPRPPLPQRRLAVEAVQPVLVAEPRLAELAVR
jgi:hypothetical protein